MTASVASSSAIGFGPARLGPPPSSTFEVHSTAHVENIAADNTLDDDSGTATKYSSNMQPPDKGKGKRVAPISSSAFSFSLGAGPSKKPRSDDGSNNNNNNKVAAQKLAVSSSTPRSPAVSKTLQQPSRTPVKAPVTTPLRPERQLDSSSAKPSPRLQAMPPPLSLTLTPKPQRTDAAQTTPTSARRAPPTFSLADASPKGVGSPQVARTRPLNPVSGSPFRLDDKAAGKAPKADSKPLQGLSSLSQMQVSQSLAPPHPAHVAETAGVVSPRKRKSARKSGEGLSTRLAHLVASADTALILFYTSLLRGARTLSGDALQRRMQDAPVLLQVTQTMRAPSPSAALAHCRVIRWAAGTGAHAADEDVMVVFKSLPQECPRIGRALERIDENTRAAVWFPTSEIALQAQHEPEPGMPDADATDGQDAMAHESSESEKRDEHKHSQEHQQGHAPGIRRADRADRADRPLPVLIASRYLLAGA